MRHRMLVIAALASGLQACGGPDSSSTGGRNGGPVPTSRMTINLTAESDDNRNTVVRVNLSDGQLFGTSYRLDGGDFLRACLNAVCRPMADNDSVFTPDYVARFDYQPGVDYVVSFNRQDARNAPDSRARLPPAFTIVTPANRQQVTDGETVIVSWSPTGAPARAAVSYQADCDHSAGPDSFSTGTLSDDESGDGSEAVRIDPIVSFARSNSPSSITGCRIDLFVRHRLEGRIDPAFHGGLATGIVTRVVRVDYVPR